MESKAFSSLSCLLNLLGFERCSFFTLIQEHWTVSLQADLRGQLPRQVLPVPTCSHCLLCSKSSDFNNLTALCSSVAGQAHLFIHLPIFIHVPFACLTELNLNFLESSHKDRGKEAVSVVFQGSIKTSSCGTGPDSS